jgi:DNA-binding CsgD family transcriptional regulator
MEPGALLASCAPRTLVVLGAAALVGREFDLSTLHHVVSADPPIVAPGDVLEAISEAERAALLEPVRRSVTRYRFADDDVVAHLVAQHTLSERAELHLRFANVLERTGGPVAAVAEHLFQAAPVVHPDRAVGQGRRAAKDALEVGAFDEAVRFLELTLHAHAFDPEPDLGERADLLVALGEAQVLAGDRTAALQSFSAALALDDTTSGTARAELAARAATAYSSWPTVPQRDTADQGLRELLERALIAIGPDDSIARATLLARLSQSMRWSVDADVGRELIVEAEQMAERLGDRDCLAAVLVARRLLTTTPDDDDERLRLSTHAVGLVARTTHPDLPLALFLHFSDRLAAGDLAGASTASAQLIDEAGRRGSPGPWWFSLRTQASLALLAGRLDQAGQLAVEARAQGKRAQHDRAELSYQIQLLHIRSLTGDVSDLLPFWQEVAPTSPWHRATYAWVAALGGSSGLASNAVEEVLALDLAKVARNANWLPLVATVGDVVVDLEMSDRMAEVREMLAPHAHRIPSIFNGLVCLGSMHRVAGRLADAAEDWDAAEQHLLAAVDAHDRMGAVLLAAASRSEYARMLRHRARPGDAARASSLLQHAIAAARARHADALTARFERSGEAGTLEQQDAPSSALSSRELEVLRLVAQGLTNKAIAGRLHISAATVQRHTINLYRKIGAAGRSDASVYAARHHLLDPDR